MDVENREGFISWMRYEVLPSPKQLIMFLIYVAAAYFILMVWVLGHGRESVERYERIGNCLQFYVEGTNDYYDCLER